MALLNTIQEIKTAVDAGKTVYADSEAYTVIKDSLGQYLIKFHSGSVIGLHGQAGTQYETTLNGHQFYTREEAGRNVHNMYADCNHEECRFSLCERFFWSHKEDGKDYFIKREPKK